MKKLWKEFKAFISRGNVLDMAVGVVIGGAFSAIVTALVNILLSICTWGVPGGLKGLVTVLPAVNDAQAGMAGIGQYFKAADLQKHAVTLAESNYATQIANDPNYLINNPNLIESAKSTILGKYTLHGTTYTYNLSAVIDWGTFINAIISFIIIAITLFVIIKVVTSLNKRRADLKAKADAAAYEVWAKNHPEEAAAKAEAEAKAKAEAEAAAAVKPATTDDVVKLLAEISEKLSAGQIKESE